jgi:hypothetical protein
VWLHQTLERINARLSTGEINQDPDIFTCLDWLWKRWQDWDFQLRHFRPSKSHVKTSIFELSRLFWLSRLHFLNYRYQKSTSTSQMINLRPLQDQEGHQSKPDELGRERRSFGKININIGGIPQGLVFKSSQF